jgi:hypothetical protein
MDRDTLIRLMREAGFTDGMVSIVGAEGFANFARLVIAHERERLMEDLAPSGSFVSWNNTKCNPLADPMMQSKSAWDDGYASGVAAEREACVDECVKQAIGGGFAADCAAAIRARRQG